jgi:hypothetical protein
MVRNHGQGPPRLVAITSLPGIMVAFSFTAICLCPIGNSAPYAASSLLPFHCIASTLCLPAASTHYLKLHSGNWGVYKSWHVTLDDESELFDCVVQRKETHLPRFLHHMLTFSWYFDFDPSFGPFSEALCHAGHHYCCYR